MQSVLNSSNLAISLLAAALIFFFFHRQSRPPLPPGPKGLPLVGNFRDLASTSHEKSWIRYSRWSEMYGDIFHLSTLGRHIVVLSSQKTFDELLNKRGDNYSDRPDMPMCMGLMESNWFFAFFRYSNWWRLHRRTFEKRFQPRVIPEYYDTQRSATALLMEKLAHTPDDFFELVQQNASSVILKIVYGYDLQLRDDPYIRLISKALEGVRQVSAFGSFWVDFFPILKYVPAWFPGASYKRKAKIWKQYGKDLTEEPWRWVRKSIEEGTAIPSYCTISAEQLGVTAGDGSTNETVIKNSAAVAHLAGADTTVSAVLTFILAMTLHPELQIRAQKEIDSVVGPERLPDFEDKENLPFVNTLIAETFRWGPVTPLNPAHSTIRDDVYEGYFIPAGTTILANVWAVFRDEKLYGPRTAEFDPDRFTNWKDADGNSPTNPEHYAFGFGRRICPGRYLALNSLYLTITYLLSTFTIAKALDEDGNEIVPEVEYLDEIVSYPAPFKCRFIPRRAKSGGEL